MQPSTRSGRGLALALALLLVPVLHAPAAAGPVEDVVSPIFGPMDGWRECTSEPLPGCELWESRVDGTEARSAALNPDGTVLYVVGQVPGEDGEEPDAAVGAFRTANGAPLWTARWDGPKQDLDYGHELAVSPDGARVLISGSTLNEREPWYSYHGFIAAFDASDGSLQWEVISQDDGQPLGQGVYDLAIDENGLMAYGVGGIYGNGTRDALAVAVSVETGEVAWVRNVDWGGNETAAAVVAAPDGDGLVLAAGGGSDVVFAALSTTGSLRHSTEQPTGVSFAYARDLLYDPLRGRLVAAVDLGFDAAGAVALDAATGEVAWFTEVPGGYWLTSLALTPALAVVAGETNEMPTLTGLDLDTGSVVWEAAPESPGGHVAVTVSPAGDVVFTAGYRGESHPFYERAAAWDARTGDLLWASQTWDRLAASRFGALVPGPGGGIVHSVSSISDGYNEVWKARAFSTAGSGLFLEP